MDWKTLIKLITELSYVVKAKNIRTFAGSAAFFFLLSIIPVLMALCSLVPFSSVTVEELTNILLSFLPSFTHEFMVMLIADVYYQSVGLLSFSTIIALWSGAMGMMALISGINVMYDIEDRRNYFHVRFIAVLYTVAFIAIIIVLIGFLIFARYINDYLKGHNMANASVMHTLLYLRIPLMFLILTCLFFLMYKFAPAKKLNYKTHIPGSLICALGWSALSWGFSIYVDHMGNFSIYGTFASAIAVLMWLYACMSMIFIGAFINKFIDEKSYKPFIDAVT